MTSKIFAKIFLLVALVMMTLHVIAIHCIFAWTLSKIVFPQTQPSNSHQSILPACLSCSQSILIMPVQASTHLANIIILDPR